MKGNTGYIRFTKLACLAHELLDKHGESLIGREIVTERNGGWPGGRSVIISLALDPEAPEIVFNVRGLEGSIKDEEIGVFDYEKVELVGAQ